MATKITSSITITAKNDIRNLKKGTSVGFPKGVTVVVGNNGSGKSTLLQAIRGKYDSGNQSLCQEQFKKLSDNFEIESEFDAYFFLDSVKDAPNSMDNAYDAMAFIKSGGYHTQTLSHGQVQKFLIQKTIDNITDWRDENPDAKGLLVLDEFDKGFDLKMQNLVYNIINNIAKKHKVSVICASHNYLLINKVYVVFDADKMEYASSREYLINLEI